MKSTLTTAFALLKIFRRQFLCLFFLLTAAPSLHALTIVRVDDPSMTDTAVISAADAASARTAFDYAAAQLAALYRDEITIYIALKPTTAVSLGGERAIYGRHLQLQRN